MNDKWLENLKIGDQVVISGGTLTGRDRLGSVVRFTNTQIVVKVEEAYESKFKKHSGHSVGDHGYYSTYIREATSDLIDKVNEERFRAVFANKLTHLSWNDVPLDIIKQVRELVEPYVKRQEK